MGFYLVFGSIKRPLGGGGTYLDWSSPDNPIGVYQADDPDDACKLAAQDTSSMGNFFAIEGIPWGIELMAPGGGRFGSKNPAEDHINRLMERLDARDEKLARLLGRGDD